METNVELDDELLLVTLGILQDISSSQFFE